MAASSSSDGPPPSDPIRALLANAFAQFDVDHNGRLSAAELIGILTRTGGGRPLSYKDAESIIASFDVDADGQLDVEEVRAHGSLWRASDIFHVTSPQHSVTSLQPNVHQFICPCTQFIKAFSGEVGVMGLVHVHAKQGNTYKFGGGPVDTVPTVGGSRRRYSADAAVPNRAIPKAKSSPDLHARRHSAATTLQKMHRGRTVRK